MRRGWGSIVKRGGRVYVQFVKADGRTTMRRLYRPAREREREIEEIRGKVEAERAGVRPLKPVRLRAWLVGVYGPVVRPQIAPGTLRAAGIHLGRLTDWVERHGNPTMDRLTRADAEHFVADLAEEDLAASYRARLVRTLRSAWEVAIVHGAARENVWRGLRPGKIAPRDVPWASPEELRRLYRAVTRSQRPLVTLLGETALRIGEALALRWEDVDLDGATLHVRQGKTEAARRTVPLTPRAVAELSRLARSKGDAVTVFRPRTTQGVRQALRRGAEKAKVPITTSHSLRHVASSHLVQAGIAPSTVAKILGHADGGVLVMKLYGRWMPRDAERAAMDRLTRFREGPRAGRAKRGKPRG